MPAPTVVDAHSIGEVVSCGAWGKSFVFVVRIGCESIGNIDQELRHGPDGLSAGVQAIQII